MARSALATAKAVDLDAFDSDAAAAVPQPRAASPASAPRAKKYRSWTALKVIGSGALGIVLAGIVWEIIATVNPFFLPHGLEVWDLLAANPLVFLRNAGSTLQVTMVGFSCSFLLAFLLATVMVHSKTVERVIMPLVVILKVTPSVAIAPALVIAFGFGFLPKYIVAGLMVFFQLLVSTLMGLRSVDPQTMDIAKTLHASKLDVLFRLRLPYALPFIFSAVKVCLPVSVIGAVVAEYVAAGQLTGLGAAIEIAASSGDMARVFANIAVLAVLGLGLSFLVTFAERFLLSWHPSSAHN